MVETDSNPVLFNPYKREAFPKLDQDGHILVECSKCSNVQFYSPRGGSIPDRPRTRCKVCESYFEIDKFILQKILNYKIRQQKFWQKTGKIKKSNEAKFGEKNVFRILKLVENGHYGSEIGGIMGLSLGKIYEIINHLQDQGYISQISSYPKFYKVGKKGKLYAQYLQKQIKKSKNLNKLSKNKKQTRVHKVAYIQKNDHIPNELITIRENTIKRVKNRFKDVEIHYTIKRVPVNNWCYFLIKVPLFMFGGISTIKLSGSSITYFFDRPKDQQYIDATSEAINQYKHDRKEDCKRAREWLNGLGYNIPPHTLNEYWDSGFHYESDKGTGTLPRFTRTLKNGKKAWNDDSLEEGEGNIESNDEDFITTLINEPEEIQANRKKIQANKQEISKLDTNLDTIKNTINNLNQTNSAMISRIEQMSGQFKQLVELLTKNLTQDQQTQTQDQHQQQPKTEHKQQKDRSNSNLYS